MTTAPITHLTMPFYLDVDHRASFSAWINHMNRATFMFKCKKGCCLVFRIRRDHISKLPSHKHLLN